MRRAGTAPVAWRFALRELRGGLAGFRVFLACLALGVAAIAAAGTVNTAIRTALDRDAQALLGGDLEVRLLYREATEAERATLAEVGSITPYTEMRAMARLDEEGSRRTMVELKGVGEGYPVYGAVELRGGKGDLRTVLAERDGMPGAAVAPGLLDRLDAEVGDRLRVGDTVLEIRAVIDREPDEVSNLFDFGPRVMVTPETVQKTGLIQPGSLVEYHYMVKADRGLGPEDARSVLDERHPEAGWRIRGTDQAVAGVARQTDRLTLFLVLVGLTSLLVGGIGVANAVKAYLDGRITTIAALKCLGAPAGLIFRVYLIQIGLIALAAVALGLVVGGGLPMILLEMTGELLPVRAAPGLYPVPLALAGLFGLLIALAFSLWPLARARDIPATALFRGEADSTTRRLRAGDLLAIGGVSVALIALTIGTAAEKGLAAWFVIGALIALGLFRLASAGLKAAARRVGRPAGYASLRLALTNLHRPGAPTTSVVLSLGLGLSVLVTVALIQGNLDRQLREEMPSQAPSFFFLDIQPAQVDPFRAQVSSAAPEATLRMADMLRGRIIALDGVPVAEATVAPDAQWAIRGDRGFTTAETVPEGSTVVEGAWWPADYQGPPLFSLTADLAQGMGLAVGDGISVNILGRTIDGTLANTRKVDWASLNMNFTFVVSPGAFAGAPRTFLATVHGTPEQVPAIERAVTDALPNVSAIRVQETLDRVVEMMETIGQAVKGAAGITLVAGGLVLAGAFAANHRRRVREAVVLKVLGATRRTVLKAYLAEYGLMGLATGVIAAVIGSVAAWAVLVFVMRAQWVFLPGTVAVTLVGCVVLTMVAGFAGTYSALGAKSAPYLRNE